MRRVLLAGFVLGCVCAAIGQTQLISNGGFENGSATPWILTNVFPSGGPDIADNISQAHGGVKFLSLGNASGADQQAYQTITIPSNAIAAGLSYFWNYNSTDASSTAGFQAAIR